MKKKDNKEIGCLGCVSNPFDSPSDPCPDAFKDHAQYCNAYSHRPVVKLENAGEEKMELISKEALITKIKSWIDDDDPVLNGYGVIETIEDFPTIESRPKGEWQLLKSGRYMCSECGELEEGSTWGFKERHNFCWNCGADMRWKKPKETRQPK